MNKTFAERMMDTIGQIDMDSTAHVDWLTTLLFEQKKSVYVYTDSLDNEMENLSVEKVFSDLTEYLEDKLGPEVKELNLGHPKFKKRYYLDISGVKEFNPLFSTMITVGDAGNRITVLIVAPTEVSEEVGSYLENLYSPHHTVEINMVTAFTDQGPVISTKKIDPTDPSLKLAHDEFYPFIEEGIEQFVHDYEVADEAAKILLGPPGTGKSTLLRTMAIMMNRKTYTISARDVLEHPGLIPFLHNIPDNSLVVLEDADEFCRSRKDHNRQMSALLNWADGVVSSGRKIIISTNLPTTKDVDPALLRGGRNHGLVVFRELDHHEAADALNVIDKPTDHLQEGKTYTLGEAITRKKVVVPQIGFIGS